MVTPPEALEVIAEKDPQVLVRMPAVLKAQLIECATASNRSLTAEINTRLQASLELDLDGMATTAQAQGARTALQVTRNQVREPQSQYRTEALAAEEISTDMQRQMIVAFSRLPADKQLALLMLIK